MKFSNYFCLVAFVWLIASPANAQDLGGLFKQLEDTLNSANQGQTNQSSNSSGSGATGGLGGLLNSLQQMDQSSSGSNAEPSSGAKEIATSNKTINFICKRQALPDIYKKLAKPNLKNLEQSFGKSASQIASIISTDTPPSPGVVPDMTVLKGAFESREIRLLFENFINHRDINDLSIMLETSKKSSFDAKAQKIANDARFAYGIVHLFFSSAGANEDLGNKLIREAAKKQQPGAAYIEGVRLYYGIGRNRDITQAVTWTLKARDTLDALKLETPMREIVGVKFYQMVSDPDYPRRDMYAQLIEMQQEFHAALMTRMSADRPSVADEFLDDAIELSRQRAELLIALGEILGMGGELEAYKAAYTEMNRQANGISLVKEYKVKTDAFQQLIDQQLEKSLDLDSAALVRMQEVHYDNGNFVSLAHSTVFAYTATLMGSGDMDILNKNTIFLLQQLGHMRARACEVNNGMLEFSATTDMKIEPSDAPISESLQRPTIKKKRRG